MRILYLHQYFNSLGMPGSTRSYEMANRMMKAGHLVHIITSDRTGASEVYQTLEDGIRVTWIPVKYENSMGSVARIRAFVDFAIRSARIAATSEADVIFASSTPLTVALPGIWAKWRQRVPMVFEVRDLWPELPIAMGVLRDPVSKWVARSLEKLAYSKSSKVIALSPGMKEGIVARGKNEKDVVVIPNACDLERFSVSPDAGLEFRSSHPWLGSRPLITYAGTIGPINGVRYMVDLAHHARTIDPHIRFLVVGAGKEEGLVRDYAREMGVLNQNFFMMNQVAKSEIPTILSASDVCLSLFIDLPEMWSNSANKFFDALAAGRPVAINYGGWQASLIQESGAGVVLPPQGEAAAAELIVQLVNDKERLVTAGERAGELARERFDRDLLAEKMTTVLESVVSSRNHPV